MTTAQLTHGGSLKECSYRLQMSRYFIIHHVTWMYGEGGGRTGHILEHGFELGEWQEGSNTTGHKYIYVNFIAGSC